MFLTNKTRSKLCKSRLYSVAEPPEIKIEPIKPQVKIWSCNEKIHLGTAIACGFISGCVAASVCDEDADMVEVVTITIGGTGAGVICGMLVWPVCVPVIIGLREAYIAHKRNKE